MRMPRASAAACCLLSLALIAQLTSTKHYPTCPIIIPSFMISSITCLPPPVASCRVLCKLFYYTRQTYRTTSIRHSRAAK
ncbi:hypothetical protein BKA63DRAFT_27453 [Paraphoma chrysanthemicola]|nr:hypothetical protein BKA63DRAFT_27453 [Paraphoma chrysanthemicola]